MSFSKKQNAFTHILFSRGTILVLFFAIIFVGYGLISLIGKSIDASRARKLAESQAETLRTHADSLSKKLSDLNSVEGQEAILREQFPVVKEGEHVIVITEQGAQTGATTVAPATNPSQKSFWDFIKNF